MNLGCVEGTSAEGTGAPGGAVIQLDGEPDLSEVIVNPPNTNAANPPLPNPPPPRNGQRASKTIGGWVIVYPEGFYHMANATDLLRKEHDAILRMLDAATRTASLLDRNERVNPDTMASLLEFFRLFADRCHHGKEEELLFPLLEKKGMPRLGGPIGVMLTEHDQGRSLIQRMADAANAYARGESGAGPRWAVAARQYAGLLRDHIMKENNVLFVMAERMLTEAEQEELAKAFDELELEKMGAGTHERLHAQMEKLLAELIPPTPA